jgi:hypothetical protein
MRFAQFSKDVGRSSPKYGDGTAIAHIAPAAKYIKSTLSSMLVTTVFTAAAAMAQDGVGLFDVYEQALLNDPLIRRAEADFLANSEIGRKPAAVFCPPYR